MTETGAIFGLAAFAILVLAVSALPLSATRSLWLIFWRFSYEEKPRPAASLQQLATFAGALLVVVLVAIIAWHGSQDLHPEEAAPAEHYVSLGSIVLASVLLAVSVGGHHRRRRLGLLGEPEEDAAINEAADSVRMPAIVIAGVAALVGILFLVPWPNGIERYPGAAYEEEAVVVPGLVDLIARTPVRVDDLGEGRIRINYLGYDFPLWQCDVLAAVVVEEDEATVSIAVQTGHEEGVELYCGTPRGLFESGKLGGGVQFYFEEQLQAPLGDRSVLLAP